MQGREREIDTLSVRRPLPHTTNLWRKRKERENSWRQKRREQLGQQKGIGPALETCRSNKIKYGVNQIIPERYWGGKKSHAVLRGSAAGRCKSIPIFYSLVLTALPVHNTIIKSCLSWISDQHRINTINMESLPIRRSFYLINEMRALVKYKEWRLCILHMNNNFAISWMLH